MNAATSGVDAELESLQRDTFRYFLLWTNPRNGLVLDKTAPDWPASIAATAHGQSARDQPIGMFDTAQTGCGQAAIVDPVRSKGMRPCYAA